MSSIAHMNLKIMHKNADYSGLAHADLVFLCPINKDGLDSFTTKMRLIFFLKMQKGMERNM